MIVDTKCYICKKYNAIQEVEIPNINDDYPVSHLCILCVSKYVIAPHMEAEKVECHLCKEECPISILVKDTPVGDLTINVCEKLADGNYYCKYGAFNDFPDYFPSRKSPYYEMSCAHKARYVINHECKRCFSVLDGCTPDMCHNEDYLQEYEAENNCDSCSKCTDDLYQIPFNYAHITDSVLENILESRVSDYENNGYCRDDLIPGHLLEDVELDSESYHMCVPCANKATNSAIRKYYLKQ
jgi:hypothetical protein